VARPSGILISLNATACRGNSGSLSAAFFEFLSAPAWTGLISADLRRRAVRLVRFDEVSFVVPILFQGIVRGISLEGRPPGCRGRDVIDGQLTLSKGFEHSSRRR